MRRVRSDIPNEVTAVASAGNSSVVIPWHTWAAYMEKEGQGAAHVGYAAGTGSYLGPSFKQAQQAEVVEASKRWSQRSDPAEVKRQMKELLVVEESEHGPGGWDAWGALEREENHERELVLFLLESFFSPAVLKSNFISAPAPTLTCGTHALLRDCRVGGA